MILRSITTVSVWCVVGIIILTPMGFAASEDTPQSAGYQYERADRREPFHPLVNPGKSEGSLIAPRPDEKNPLTKFELGQLRVTGIILGKLGTYATLSAPDGKTYMITVGTRVGKYEGTVIAIAENVVVVKERKRFQVRDEMIVEEHDVPLYLDPLKTSEQVKSRFVVLGK